MVLQGCTNKRWAEEENHGAAVVSYPEDSN